MAVAAEEVVEAVVARVEVEAVEAVEESSAGGTLSGEPSAFAKQLPRYNFRVYISMFEVIWFVGL